MDKGTHEEMNTKIKELKDFATACTNLATRIEAIKAKTIQWENRLENAEMLARQAQADLEQKQATLMMELNRLPQELAPLRNKIAQQDKESNNLLTKAMADKKEAAALLAQAKAISEETRKASTTVETNAEAEKRGPGRPKKEPVATK